MKLQYWIVACAASAAAAFAGCSYNHGQVELSTPSGAGFFLTEDGGSAKLAYGAADSDDVGLMLECDKGSRLVRVSDIIRSNPAPTLVLTSAGGRSELKAAVEAGEGQPLVTASAPSGADAFDGFRKSGKIEVGYAGLRYNLAAKPFEKPMVERFFAMCDGRKA